MGEERGNYEVEGGGWNGKQIIEWGTKNSREMVQREKTDKSEIGTQVLRKER